ncbi:MAG: hypothetical protein HY718_15425 [Planctomycetes bacterium]|nr:hypothetical protein [Planctomycetota bacterium]
MRRVTLTVLKLIPMSTLLVLGSCGITEVQLKDFVATTGIRVFSQGLTSYLQAFVIDTFGA